MSTALVSRKINQMARRAEDLRKLRKILNEIKSNGVYSEINSLEEANNLEKAYLRASPTHKKMIAREEKLLNRAWEVRRKLSKQLMDELEKFLDEMEVKK